MAPERDFHSRPKRWPYNPRNRTVNGDMIRHRCYKTDHCNKINKILISLKIERPVGSTGYNLVEYKHQMDI
ncbi:hypothetical protein Hanom_Chr12g01106141 [Helianthus anomalus]